VLEQWLEWVPRVAADTRVVVISDRPHRAVREVVNRWRPHPRFAGEIQPSRPILSKEFGANWMEPLNEALDYADRLDWVRRAEDEPERSFWLAHGNDDWILGPGWKSSLRHCLLMSENDVWAWEALSLFLWDEREEQANVRIEHCSPLFGRYRRGWRHPVDMEIQVVREVQERIAQVPRVRKMLPFYVFDIGAKTEEARQRIYHAYAEAGRVDNYVRKFIEAPVLMPVCEIVSTYKPREFRKVMAEVRRIHG